MITVITQQEVLQDSFFQANAANCIIFIRATSPVLHVSLWSLKVGQDTDYLIQSHGLEFHLTINFCHLPSKNIAIIVKVIESSV